METIEITIPRSGSYRASEMIADLRNAADVLFFPMKTIGYWDIPTNDHACPQAQRHRPCPHILSPSDPSRVSYEHTVEHDLDGVLEVAFPHAQVRLFLG